MDLSDDEFIKYEADLFYDNVRAIVIVFLFSTCFLTISYFILVHLRHPREPHLSNDDIYIHRFVMGTCSCILALSMTLFIILPMSILANEILVLFPKSYYMQWFNTSLMNILFNAVIISYRGACISVPFNLFLLSSHSMYTGRKAITARFLHSSVYLLISYTAFFGALTTVETVTLLIFAGPNSSITSILPRFCFTSNIFCFSRPLRLLADILCCMDAAIAMSQRVISYVGLVLLLVCMPYGVICLLLLTIRISLCQSKNSLSSTEALQRHQFEQIDIIFRNSNAKCLAYIQKLNHPFSTASNQLYSPIIHWLCLHTELESLKFSSLLHEFSQLSEIEEMRPLNKYSSLFELNTTSICEETKQIVSLVILVILLALLIISAIFTTANILILVYGLFFTSSFHPVKMITHFPYSDYSMEPEILIGRESASTFGYLGAILQILLVIFMVCTSLFGFYSFPLVQTHLLPRPHRTPIARLLGNAICILTISFAVPLQATLLGLTNPAFPLHAVSFTNWFCRPASEGCGAPNPCSPTLIHPIVPALSLQPPLLSFIRDSPEQQLKFRPPQDPPNERIDLLQIINFKEGEANAKLYSSSLTQFISRIYPGLDPHSCDLLLALAYNLGFLLISYWLFKRHLRPLTHLFHLQEHFRLPLQFKVISQRQPDVVVAASSSQ